jgi:hypothetical protein
MSKVLLCEHLLSYELLYHRVFHQIWLIYTFFTNFQENDNKYNTNVLYLWSFNIWNLQTRELMNFSASTQNLLLVPYVWYNSFRNETVQFLTDKNLEKISHFNNFIVSRFDHTLSSLLSPLLCCRAPSVTWFVSFPMYGSQITMHEHWKTQTYIISIIYEHLQAQSQMNTTDKKSETMITCTRNSEIQK